MGFVYQATQTAGNASGGALAINRDASVADGHFLLAGLYLENDVNGWSSVPSGWEVGPAIANTGLFKLWTYYKIAASEPASWTWTPSSSNWRTGFVANYSGPLGSNLDREENSGSDQGDSVIAGSQTAPSVETFTNDALVTFIYGNFSGSDPSSVSGFCTNLRSAFGGLTLADAIKATPGFTGPSNPGGVGSEDFAALHIVWKLDTGGGVTFKASYRQFPKFLLRKN